MRHAESLPTEAVAIFAPARPSSTNSEPDIPLVSDPGAVAGLSAQESGSERLTSLSSSPWTRPLCPLAVWRSRPRGQSGRGTGTRPVRRSTGCDDARILARRQSPQPPPRRYPTYSPFWLFLSILGDAGPARPSAAHTEWLIDRLLRAHAGLIMSPSAVDFVFRSAFMSSTRRVRAPGLAALRTPDSP